MPDHYQVLEIPREADLAAIKAAYKRLALKYHPDRNPNNPFAEDYFKRVNEAYYILGDTSRKYQYDLSLYTPPPPPPVYQYQTNPQTTTHQTHTHQGYSHHFDSAVEVPSLVVRRKIWIATAIGLLLVVVSSYFIMQYFNQRTAERYYREAENFYRQGLIPAAIVKIGFAIAYNAKYYPAYELRGKINLERTRNFFRAWEDYDFVIQNIEKPSAELYYRRGLCNLNRYETALALQDFNLAISLEPRRGEFFYHRAVAKADLKASPQEVCADFALGQSLGYVESIPAHIDYCEPQPAK